jgi:cell division septation protein DedD
VKYKDKDGNARTLVVEIKPAKDLKMPETNPNRRTKSWAYSVQMWAINQAKWEAAKNWCADRKYEFKIFTELELGIKVK